MSRHPSFEWDDLKDRTNSAKHGVSFGEAQAAFFDPHRVIAEDIDHGGTERRYFCLGRVRIFGAGYWRKGRRIYEQQNRD